VEIEEKPKPQNIVLSIDIMYFTGIPFLVTVSRNIRFITATLLSDRKKSTIMKALQQVFRVYQGRGHRIENVEFLNEEVPVHTILADNEFQALRDDIEELGINVHIVTKDEHVPEVERQNRVIKERARATVQTLPYKKLPKKIRVALIQYVIFWLNNIPKEDQVQSPRTLIMGEQVLDYNNLCKIPFGAYVQVHDDAQTTNTMEPRTTGGINLGPSNMQGGHKFFNLGTGEIIISRKWTELPIPSEVIIRVEELAGDPHDSVTDMITDDMMDADEDEQNEVEEEIPQDEAVIAEENPDNERGQTNEGMEQEVPMRLNENEHEVEGIMIREEEQELHEQQEANLYVSTSDETMVTANTERGHRYDLRPNRTRDYSHRYKCLISVKAGLRKWGEKAPAAVLEELMGFIKEKVFKNIKKPTAAQMEKALHIHCFVIEKRDGRIKARAVADGRTQMRYSEEETYSPTVKLESLMLNSLIDAFEQRHVATVDIKGAFLKAKVPEELELIVKMGGELAQMMCELDPLLECDAQGYLYMQCEKALYGHIEAARLFYDDLNESLTAKMKFERNRYDPCVYNRQTKDGRVTIRVHVDDLKISSRSRKQLMETIQQLRNIYKEITVHEGLSHDYLGILITYQPDEQSVTLDMKNYIQGCIDQFLQEHQDIVLRGITTPATDNLFKIRSKEEAIPLGKEKAKTFHSTVAKLLFLAKRGRPDILLAVSFLTTRVKEPDEDDWKKLIRVLSYLNGTLGLVLSISCKDMDELTWYVDGSYAIHDDMKGQSGAVLLVGDNVVLTRSSKQKVNTRSSTEAEIIAIDDTLPTIQWAKSYLKDQGYDMDTIIREDNKSTILLMKNGRLSAGKRTKHLDIRYFYVKDLIDRGIVSVEHCSTMDMIADFFTKPIQGKRFQILRDIILNRRDPDVSTSQYRSVLGNSTRQNIVSVETRAVETKTGLKETQGATEGSLVYG
jgi:hypothetical protein